MPGSTANYALPYQQVGDSPNGAQGQQNLAQAVDAVLTRMDTVSTTTVFTAGGSFAKPTGCRYVKVRLVGGGGGGGVGFTTAAGQGSAGGGGGGGGYAEETIPASSLTASTTVTVGAGGLGANPPTAGGSSAFGAFLSATGGGAGTSMSPITNGTSDGGQGGAGTGGSINIDGQDGDVGRVGAGEPQPARGGSSQLGAGGRQGTNVNTAVGAIGQAYGGGGAGGACRPVFGPALGGNGTQGVVIVEAYF